MRMNRRASAVQFEAGVANKTEVEHLCDLVTDEMNQQVARGIDEPPFITIVDRVIGFARQGWDTRQAVINEMLRRGWKPQPRPSRTKHVQLLVGESSPRRDGEYGTRSFSKKDAQFKDPD